MRPSMLLMALAPFAFALPTPNAPRAAATDADKLVAAITTIQTNIAAVTKALNAFSKSHLTAVVEVLTVQGKTIDLENSLKNATAVANQAQQLSSDDSGTVAVSVINLSNDIGPVLDLLVAKKPDIDGAILGLISASPQVLQDLQNLKSYSDAFGAALTKKLDATYASVAPTIISQIDSQFDTAIAAYKKSGGLLALPPFPDFTTFKSAVQKAEASGSV